MKLTNHQRKIVTLLAQGYDINQAGYALGITGKGASTVLRYARIRKGAKTVYQLIAIAVAEGEIEWDK